MASTPLHGTSLGIKKFDPDDIHYGIPISKTLSYNKNYQYQNIYGRAHAQLRYNPNCVDCILSLKLNGKEIDIRNSMVIYWGQGNNPGPMFILNRIALPKI